MIARVTRPVALVGLPGAGKSTVGPRLASRLKGEFIDLDARVEARAGATVARLFAQRGEREFRRLEVAELAAAIDSSPALIACGGGIVETVAGLELLRGGCRVVWLEVAPDEAALRLGAGAAGRPLLEGATPAARLGDLLARRAAAYAEVAHARVSTDGLDLDQVAARVALALERLADHEGAA